MLMRSHVLSILMLGAGLSLSSCSGADWRRGVEKPEDCVLRLSELAEELLSQPALVEDDPTGDAWILRAERIDE